MTEKHSHNDVSKQKPSLSIWISILLIIVFVFAIVMLFGALIYVFTRGVQHLGLSTPGHVVVFVVISGIFAWLLKRITDTVSGMSHIWFPEETDEQD